MKSIETSTVPAEPASTESKFTATRRGFLAASGGTAAAVAIGSRLLASAYARPAVNLGARTDLNFLMQRMTRGYNRTEMGYLLAVNATPAAYRDLLLDIAPTLPDTTADTWVSPLMTYLNLPPCNFVDPSLPGSCAPSQPYGVARHMLRWATIGRSVHTRNWLHDRLVELWSNHLSIHLDREAGQILKHWDDKTVVRPNAMGKFHTLLLASARSPAMLFYLDNYLNGVRSGTPPLPVINENYARELLELHTLAPKDRVLQSPPNNYTQEDVIAAAKIMSGWRIRMPGWPLYPQDMGSNWGEFHFDSNNHVSGKKKILDLEIEDALNPEEEGKTLLRYLADPTFVVPNGQFVADKTARFVAFKMLRWFLTPQPTQAQVAAVAQVYLTTGGDIKEMLRLILSPSYIQSANIVGPANPSLKFKTPYELMCSLFRATEASLEFHQGAERLVVELESMGNSPFAWGTPDGYPVDAQAWASNLLPRWSFCQRFFDRQGDSIPGINGVVLDDAKLAQMLTGDPNEFSLDNIAPDNLPGLIEDMLVGSGAMDPADKQAIASFKTALVATGQFSKPVIARHACSLAASLPSFQRF